MKTEYEQHNYIKSQYHKDLAYKRMVKKIKDIAMTVGEWILIVAFFWVFFVMFIKL
jgi:hypothetical protein